LLVDGTADPLRGGGPRDPVADLHVDDVTESDARRRRRRGTSRSCARTGSSSAGWCALAGRCTAASH
jgi:hypothetical protein